MPIDFPIDRYNKTTRTREPKPDPRDECAAADRAAYGKTPWGHRCRAAFYQFLPEAPKVARGSRDLAKWYVSEIDRVIEMQMWSREEQDRLRFLRKKWERRAEGRDSRYLERGTQGGRPAQGRKRSAPEIINAIYDLLDQSGGQKTTRPEVRFVQDKAWPYGRPVR